MLKVPYESTQGTSALGRPVVLHFSCVCTCKKPADHHLPALMLSFF